ncbi:MAG TPA: DNA primase [Candidatus Saccharimonadales bacterium]
MDAVEEIKQRLSIEDVVGEYVELKRAGRNWKGLSPFANEKSPSFMVSPEKQIWHDFSSGKGGNMFSFVMEMEGLDFKGALELLARKAGIDLEQYRTSGNSQRGKEKERLYEVMLEATRYYYGQLRQPQNKSAYDYVHQKRRFSDQTLLEWRIGYSPESGDALVKHLKGKGFTPQEIKAAGLATDRYRGRLRDMFRGRIMIPLADQHGRVIGFTARLLRDDPNAPKYINTPQTPLYDKSNHVFGFHLAKEAIRKSGFVVIAEGNLDVISSHQAGIRQVVATAGTALTERQLKTLSRFTGDIRLSFDADNAGVNATERAIPLASKINVGLSVITIPSGKDPDELIKQDPAIWRDVITKPQYALDWLIAKYQKQLDISTAQGKKKFSDIVMKTVNMLQDSVEKEHYIAALTQIIGVSQDALRTKLERPASLRKLKNANKHQSEVDRAHVVYIERQNIFLSMLLRYPEFIAKARPLDSYMLPQKKAKDFFELLVHRDVQSEKLTAELAEYKTELLTFYEDETKKGPTSDSAEMIINQLKAFLIVAYAKKVLPEITNQYLSENDEQKRGKLREKNTYFNQLLSKYDKR